MKLKSISYTIFLVVTLFVILPLFAQEKIKELSLAREALKMKAFSCDERIKELKGLQEIETTKTEPVN